MGRGANGQIFSPTQNGSYAVELEENCCINTSDCIVISSLGLVDLAGGGIILYPNPTSGDLNVISSTPVSSATVVVRNAMGQELTRQINTHLSGISLDANAPAGIYFVEITHEGKTFLFKMIKE